MTQSIELVGGAFDGRIHQILADPDAPYEDMPNEVLASVGGDRTYLYIKTEERNTDGQLRYKWQPA